MGCARIRALLRSSNALAFQDRQCGSTLPIMVGAVIYVRVSTKEQTENLSLPTQLRACEEHCRRQGYEILERFHEEGESIRGLRDGPLHERRTAETGQDVGAHESTRQAAHVASDRHVAAQPVVRLHRRRARVRRPQQARPLRAADLREVFYRVQAILSGRVARTAPRPTAHPDFPLRGFVRCKSCARGLTGQARGTVRRRTRAAA
jgi:hypothetical protein